MAAVITATGTWTTPQSLARPVGGSGTEVDTTGGTAYDSRTSLQRGLNLFDEFNQFIALAAANLQVPGFAVVDQLRLMLADIRRQPSMGERVYAP